MTTQPFVSVVIPTFNRPARLDSCLAAFTRVRYPKDRFEVIVVDDGSPQDLRPVVERHAAVAPIRYLRQQNQGPAIARNFGLGHVRGQLVAFTDDDCEPAEGWIAALAAHASDHPDAAIGGRVINALPANPYSAASQMLVDYLYEYFNSGGGRTALFTSNNIAFPAETLRQLGGFDQNFALAAGEDRELCDRWMRQNLPLFYVPAAEIRHSHQLSLTKFWRQHFNYGRGAHQYHRKRAQYQNGKVKVEPTAFYSNLLLYPFRKLPFWRALPIAALFALSQVANVYGYFWQSRQARPGRPVAVLPSPAMGQDRER